MCLQMPRRLLAGKLPLSVDDIPQNKLNKMKIEILGRKAGIQLMKGGPKGVASVGELGLPQRSKKD